jgi:hypothetical protein
VPRSFCFQPGPTKAEPLGLNQQQYNVAPLKDSVQLVDLPKFFDEFVWFMLDISNQFSWVLLNQQNMQKMSEIGDLTGWLIGVPTMACHDPH